MVPLARVFSFRSMCGRNMSTPPFGGRSSFPSLKGTKERIGVFKTEQEGGFVQFHAALFQVMTGKFAARIFNKLLKGDACVSKPTLKRPCARAKFCATSCSLGRFPAN